MLPPKGTHHRPCRFAALATICLGGMMLGLADVSAQSYPSRAIKMIVPFSAGGQPDAIARLIAQHLSRAVGTVVIDNRPGGNTMIGARAAAAAEPDGYTLFFGSSTSLGLAPALQKNPGYDPVKNFTATAPISSAPFIVVVGPSVPATTIAELIAYAKAHPGKLNFAGNPGGPPRLAGEMFKAATGVNIVPISYRAMTQAFTDLMAGQMDIIFDAPAGLIPLIREGKARALAVFSDKRMDDLPDVPTTTESGLSDLQLVTWNGVVAPASTPDAVVTKVSAAMHDGLRSPQMRVALATLGSAPMIEMPDVFAARIASEAKKWADFVRAAGVKLE